MNMNVYGLSISVSAIFLLGWEGKKIKKEKVKLNPGVFKNGQLKNWKPLLRSLIILRSKFKGIAGKIPVVFSLPECGIQIRRFNLPAGEKGDISASAALNLQMISPIDVRDAYYDWQNLDGEFLGAFVHRGIVEQYLRLLSEADFLAVAVEFPALAIARLVKEQAPHLVIFVSENGLEIFIVKNGNLYSRNFINLNLFGNFNEALIQGIGTAIGQEAVTNVILIAPSLYQKIEQAVKEHFPNLRIKPFAPPEFFDVAPVWYVSLGGAIRGIGRGKKLIDLSPPSFQDEIAKLKKQVFILTWQKFILKVSAAIAVILLAGAVLAALISNRLEKKIGVNSQSAEFQEAQFLKKIQTAKDRSNDFSGILEKLRVMAAPDNIIFEQLIIKGEEGKIILNGLAVREADIIKFKDKLAATELFKEIVLPLSEITANSAGGVDFALTLDF